MEKVTWKTPMKAEKQFMSLAESRRFAQNIGDDINRDRAAESSLADQIEERIRREAREYLSKNFGTNIPPEAICGFMIARLCRDNARLAFSLCDLMGVTAELRSISKCKLPEEIEAVIKDVYENRQKAAKT